MRAAAAVPDGGETGIGRGPGSKGLAAAKYLQTAPCVARGCCYHDPCFCRLSLQVGHGLRLYVDAVRLHAWNNVFVCRAVLASACVAQRPKQPKRRRRRRAHTPPDTTDDEGDEEEEQGEGDQAQGRGQDGRRRRPRPSMLTRLRRWWRRRWFHFHRRYLLALRRKDLPRWRAVFWDVAYRCGDRGVKRQAAK